ncbi:Protein kinase superfamily protein [Rhynchospora pubera]|uniref:non-specific serine/threonine protein kinase n=1 Tax=Rhynchospora pubera TaxID=906938 RepID=A0AAV8ESN5_9POAL|nr:Protein kinase superfamily protein [Rhynchospora pubera]
MFGRYRTYCCACVTFTSDEQELGLPDARVSDEPLYNDIKTGNKTIRQLGWKEIDALTGGFTSAVVGEGGFSTVYLARVPGFLRSTCNFAAVKVHRGSERLNRVFKQELDVLKRVQHPHIVRLLGFCEEREEGVLVLEFAPNGNLHDKLHSKTGSILPWQNRATIATQIARALEHLHEKLDLQIIHGDIKASNILLDSKMDAKLCDFGSAKMGFSAMVQPRSAHQITGSPGYIDPHYIRSGTISKKNDVYSFGVLLFEILTGIEAFCAKKEQLLTAVLRPKLKNVSAEIECLVDKKLERDFHREEAVALASLAASCINENASMRPSMAEVVRILEEKLACSISAVGFKSDGKKL